MSTEGDQNDGKPTRRFFKRLRNATPRVKRTHSFQKGGSLHAGRLPSCVDQLANAHLGTIENKGMLMDNMAEASEATVDAVPGSISIISGAAEIISTKTDDDVDALIEECEKLTQLSVFASADAHIHQALIPSYRLYLRVKDSKEAHQRLIYHLKRRDPGLRSPSVSKAAYNSVIAACAPNSLGQRSQASDWANLLLWAAEEKVPTDTFESWIGTRSVRDAKSHMRKCKSPAGPSKPRMKYASDFLKGYPSILQAMSNSKLLPKLKEGLLELEITLRAASNAE